VAERVYTESFVRTSVTETWVDYVVPPGKRAVVKCVTAVGYDSGSWASIVMVAAIEVSDLFATGRVSLASPGLTVVAYAGDAIGVLQLGGTVFTTVSGYLFDDPDSRAPAVEHTPIGVERPAPHPSTYAF
jgi:hypothetical protein